MPILERIQSEVERYPIVLFMKGTPEWPMCGFSNHAATALRDTGVEGVHFVNVLEHPEIRANLPRYSHWPTLPQLFIHGEFIGGCDIILELHDSGELTHILADAADLEQVAT